MKKKVINSIKEHKMTFCCCAMFFLLIFVYLFYLYYKIKLSSFNNLESYNWQVVYAFAFPIIIFLILILSGVITIYYEAIDKLLELRKLHAVIFSCIVFFAFRIYFINKYYSFFSFDEFYHISTLNPNYITNYARADYINSMAKIICSILGQSDFSVKLVPFILGSISFLCALYLLYSIYNNSYWIITISFIITFMPYIAYNHFYIRMYVFLEAVVMVNCFLIYNAEKKRGTLYGIIYVVLAEILTVLYSVNTKDFSAKALFLLMGIVGAHYFLGNQIRKIINRFLGVKLSVIIFFGGLMVAVGYIVAAKQHWIKSSILESDTLIKLMGMNLETFYHAECPVFLEYIFLDNFYVSIPFIISCGYVWKNKINDKKVLFIIACLPLVGYMILLYNSYLIRTYIAFFPIMCVLSYYIFDKINLSKLQHLAIIVITVLLTLHIGNDFWVSPCIPNETRSCNLGKAFQMTQELEKEGYKIVTLMTYETQSAYFDLLDAEMNLNCEDLREELKKRGEEYTREEENIWIKDTIVSALEDIFDSDMKYIIIADANGTAYLNLFDWDNIGKEKYRREMLEGYTSIVAIN